MNRPVLTGLTCLVLTIITVACGSAAQAGSLSMPPVNPRHVVIAHSIRAIPGERNGAQVYLALTRPDLTGPQGTAAEWQARVLAGEAAARPGTHLIRVGVVSTRAELANGRLGTSFRLSQMFTPTTVTKLRNHITAKAHDFGLHIDSLTVRDTANGPSAIITATYSGTDLDRFVQNHPSLALDLAGGPNSSIFAQVLGNDGHVAVIDAGDAHAEVNFGWVNPSLPAPDRIGQL